MRSSPTGAARGGDSSRVVLGRGGHRRVVRDGGQLALIFSDGGACPVALRLDQDNE
jgi:hypothetical protein